ncbi:MAG: hypothetical protein K0S65_1257 [Labilithrix sp.]|nr:hypothetical protein [Labilithrix sp.]
MDERTRAATYEDVVRIAELLESEGVEYALIGGYALALQGIVRLTEDVDVLVEPSLENSRRWVRALSKLPDGAARELEGDDTLHEELYAIRINDEFTVDVMNSASGYSWQQLLPYRKRIEGINVLSLEGLLLMKKAGRLKDQADAEAIRKALESKPA